MPNASLRYSLFNLPPKPSLAPRCKAGVRFCTNASPFIFVQDLYVCSQLKEEWDGCREGCWEDARRVLGQWKETGWLGGVRKQSLGRQLIALHSFHPAVLPPTAWSHLKLKDNIGTSTNGHNVFPNKFRLPLRCGISYKSPGFPYLHPALSCSARTVCSHVSGERWLLEEGSWDDGTPRSRRVLGITNIFNLVEETSHYWR